MSITLLGTGSVFSRLGKLFKILRSQHIQSSNLTQFTNDALASIGSLYGIAAPLAASLPSFQQSLSIPGPTLQSVAQALLCKMVNDDAPLANQNDVGLAMRELIRQMLLSNSGLGTWVSTCTLGASTSALSTNSGNGVPVVSFYRNDNFREQNMSAETGEVVITSDAASGAVAAGSEPWNFQGDQAPGDVLGFDWPGFSGGGAGGTVINSQGGLSLLGNGGFESWSSTDQAAGWTYGIGVATTHYAREASIIHRGTYSLKLKGDGSTLHRFGRAITGLLPNRVYAFSAYARLSSGVGSGKNLSFYLDDTTLGGSNVFGDNGSDPTNITTVNTSALSSSVWTNVSGVFVTGRVPPVTGLGLAVEIGTAAIPNGEAIYLDSIAVAEMTRLYPGGPALAVFAGTIPFARGDGFLVTTTNDRAGLVFGGTFQTAFERFFGMTSLGLQLPYYSGSGVLVPDTLITA